MKIVLPSPSPPPIQPALFGMTVGLVKAALSLSRRTRFLRLHFASIPPNTRNLGVISQVFGEEWHWVQL